MGKKHQAIDADSAHKLAGLQQDLLSKYRAGQVTLKQLEWFLGLTKEMRHKLSHDRDIAIQNAYSKEPAPKFRAVEEYGPFEVDSRLWPIAYEEFRSSDMALATLNRRFDNSDYSLPTDTLRPGDKIKITIYEHLRGSKGGDSRNLASTGAERLAMLKARGSLLLGVQGLYFAWQHLRGTFLSIGLSAPEHQSYDEPERLIMTGEPDPKVRARKIPFIPKLCNGTADPHFIDTTYHGIDLNEFKDSFGPATRFFGFFRQK